MFSIGEFSKITGLTVKALRFYHEEGLLEPSRIDPGNGYRFYSQEKVETARAIAALRDLEFSLSTIREILGRHDDDADLITLLRTRQAELSERIRADRRLARSLNNLIQHEQEAIRVMSKSIYEVEEKRVDPILIASLRMRGAYSECGKGFQQIARRFGRHLCGKPMLLCHDSEYREEADYEVAMPVKRGESTDEITVQKLPGGRCLSLIHLGPYETLGRSYEKLLKHARDHGLGFKPPTREIYLKGPGMIFRSNPKKYLTEIQLML